MFHTLVSTLVAGVLATLIGASVAAATRRWWVGSNYLGVCWGITGVATASYLMFLATWASPIAGKLLSLVFLAASVIVLFRSRAWRAWRQAAPMALITAGTIVVYVGFMYLWRTHNDVFSLAEARFTGLPLPIDNRIPALFADRLAAGQSTHLLVGDWNGSDRPPLQAGLVLLARVLDGRISGSAAQGYGASIVAQALWIPALYALLRSAAIPRRPAVAGVVMVAVTGTTLLNTVFTWPKMMSAALILVSCAFLVHAARRPSTFGRYLPLAVAMFAFAMLAHGAAAFAVPVVVILGLVALRRQRARSAWRAIVVAAGVGAAVYLPWALYQRFADPPGDRLLKWHLAGVIPPDDPRSAWRTIGDSWGSLSLHDWWSGRLQNLSVVMGPKPWAGFNCGCEADLGTRRVAEFVTTTAALGVAFPLLVAVLAVVAVLLVKRRHLGLGDVPLLIAVTASAASIAMWCLLMFIPGSTVVHQGSQAWIFLLIVAPTVWLAIRKLWLAWALVAVQGVVTFALYAPVSDGEGLSVRGLVVFVAGLLVCIEGVLYARVPSSHARFTLNAVEITQ